MHGDTAVVGGECVDYRSPVYWWSWRILHGALKRRTGAVTGAGDRRQLKWLNKCKFVWDMIRFLVDEMRPPFYDYDEYN